MGALLQVLQPIVDPPFSEHIVRELRALGAPQRVAQRVAANSRCWWRNSAKLLNSVLTIDYDDRLGVPRLS